MTTNRRARSGRWPWVLLALLATSAALLVLVLGVLALWRPAGYAPRSVDFNRLDDDKRAVWGLADRVSATLAAGRPVREEFSEAQLNRWMAARAELWPEQGELVPAPFERPVVTLLPDGRVRLAALVQQGGWRFVLTLELRVDLEEQGVTVRCTQARLGTLSVPAWLRERALRTAAAGIRGVEVLPAGGMRLPVRFRWPNGDVPVRLTELEIDEGVARVSLEPEGPRRR